MRRQVLIILASRFAVVLADDCGCTAAIVIAAIEGAVIAVGIFCILLFECKRFNLVVSISNETGEEGQQEPARSPPQEQCESTVQRKPFWKLPFRRSKVPAAANLPNGQPPPSPVFQNPPSSPSSRNSPSPSLPHSPPPNPPFQNPPSTSVFPLFQNPPTIPEFPLSQNPSSTPEFPLSQNPSSIPEFALFQNPSSTSVLPNPPLPSPLNEAEETRPNNQALSRLSETSTATSTNVAQPDPSEPSSRPWTLLDSDDYQLLPVDSHPSLSASTSGSRSSERPLTVAQSPIPKSVPAGPSPRPWTLPESDDYELLPGDSHPSVSASASGSQASGRPPIVAQSPIPEPPSSWIEPFRGLENAEIIENNDGEHYYSELDQESRILARHDSRTTSGQDRVDEFYDQEDDF